MFAVFLVCIWTEYGNTPYLSVFSPNLENRDKKNSEYEHFSQSAFDSHFPHLQNTGKLCACLKNLNQVAVATDQNFPGKILIGLTLTR